MDAQRGEVYARLYARAETLWQPVTEPTVDRPGATLAAWAECLGADRSEFVGDGAVAYRAELETALGPQARLVAPVPPLAPIVAAVAERMAAVGHAVAPGAIRPLYVRRPDAELSRDRKARTSV